jgi:hypothetical protein
MFTRVLLRTFQHLAKSILIHIEQIHLMFCERILKVRFTTPNYIVYGELVRFPLEIIIKNKLYNAFCAWLTSFLFASKKKFPLHLESNQDMNKYQPLQFCFPVV